MPWDKTPAQRQRDNANYGSDWRKARQQALARTGRRCEKCGATRELQVDHITPVSQGGTHAPANLQVLCGGCHRAKTATEGGGYRSTRRGADPEPTSRVIGWDE